ncbi:transcriptional regulator, AraC family with amidase-like domain [Cribrihabitans marinus]|uniref:Transcriptional regulator, AraC family with amidase-like domain n=2 Tax=Cribrihabitans marinus TaxID=1227549 RepID=A0A1H7AAD7_9RHOB|nr:transcriptional regulator, AraC family with amidase-like domain [Cribrihabitans marinus]
MPQRESNLMKSAKNILQPEHRALKTGLLVLDDCNTLSFAAAVDPMRAANRLADRPAFDWDYVTAGDSPARLTSMLQVPGVPLARFEQCELMIVVAGFQLARHARPSLLSGLRRIAGTGAAMAGIDGGPWLLAEAGLLDGHAATTHWEDLENFAIRFPQVDVRPDRFVASDTRLTSGGATPAIEMMLHVIAARHGAGFAARVAGLFLYDGPQPATRPQSRLGHHRHTALTARAHALMEAALDDPLPLAEIARQLGSSARSLQQQFRLRLDTTPQDHYLQLRLAEARRLVTDTDMPLMQVAMATGFTSQSSFARAFRTAHGLSARDLRASRATAAE